MYCSLGNGIAEKLFWISLTAFVCGVYMLSMLLWVLSCMNLNVSVNCSLCMLLSAGYTINCGSLRVYLTSHSTAHEKACVGISEDSLHICGSGSPLGHFRTLERLCLRIHLHINIFCPNLKDAVAVWLFSLDKTKNGGIFVSV